MEGCRNRKKDPCTTYRREGKTKQNFYECLPTAFEFGRKGKNCRSGAQANQDPYECCPPTPVELRCSVCWTAERDGCNLWTCVPFMSYSVLCGPTLADLLVHLLNLLPLSVLACLGIAHPRCCSAKPSPPLIKCPPVTKTTHTERRADRARDRRPYPCPMPSQKRPCPCPMDTAHHTEGGDGPGSPGCANWDDMSDWMREEYISLARELAEIRRLTNDDDSGETNANKDLLQARGYVLDRLAEMLGKREEIERRMNEKMQQNR